MHVQVLCTYMHAYTWSCAPKADRKLTCMATMLQLFVLVFHGILGKLMKHVKYLYINGQSR